MPTRRNRDRMTPAQKQYDTITRQPSAEDYAVLRAMPARQRDAQRLVTLLGNLRREFAGHAQQRYEQLTGGAEYRTAAATIDAAIRKLERIAEEDTQP